jgi:hypothetical protein
MRAEYFGLQNTKERGQAQRRGSCSRSKHQDDELRGRRDGEPEDRRWQAHGDEQAPEHHGKPHPSIGVFEGRSKLKNPTKRSNFMVPAFGAVGRFVKWLAPSSSRCQTPPSFSVVATERLLVAVGVMASSLRLAWALAISCLLTFASGQQPAITTDASGSIALLVPVGQSVTVSVVS